MAVSGFKIDILAIKKQKNEIEHSYFKNKFNISYLSEDKVKLPLLKILVGLPIVFILFFNIVRFLFNLSTLINLITLLMQHRKKYKYVYATFNIISAFYGIFFKKISSPTKLGFGIFDYYGGIFKLKIPEKHINYHPWLNYKLIRFTLSYIDFYTAFKENFKELIKNLLKNLHIETDFKFYIVNPTLSFCPVKINTYKKPESNKQIHTVSIAGFEKFKGTFDFLDTAKEFIRNSNEFKFTFVGMGEAYEKLQKFIEDEKLTGKIKIIKATDRTEVLKLIMESELVIHTSYIETGPIVLIEALVCRKPILIMDVGIAKNIASFCKSVYIYTDFEDLLQKLKNISKNKEIILNPDIPDLFLQNTHFNATVQKLCWIFR